MALHETQRANAVTVKCGSKKIRAAEQNIKIEAIAGFVYKHGLFIMLAQTCK